MIAKIFNTNENLSALKIHQRQASRYLGFSEVLVLPELGRGYHLLNSAISKPNSTCISRALTLIIKLYPPSHSDTHYTSVR